MVADLECVTLAVPMRTMPLVVGLAAAAAGLIALAIAVRAWRAAEHLFNPPPTAVSWPAAVALPAGLVRTAFNDTAGHAIAGWHVPSRNGATIVLIHGSVSTRAQLAPEARLLTDRGFGVLLYDEPGCGESEGRVTFGPSERAAMLAALDWLRQREPGVAIGVYGFSQGAYIAAQVAPTTTDVRALVLAGAVADFREQTRFDFRQYGPLSMWPALAARERAGWVPSDPSPLDVIGTFRRPLLLVSGDRDVNVPPDHSARLFAAAADPKELWMVHGAAHGGYADAAPVDYPARLAGFYERAMLR